ncbi:MAG: hypothetical protein RL477_1641 [Pseudomonadota bacterium]
MSRRVDIFGLVFFLAVGAGVLAAGGSLTATSVGTWYQGLVKPAFNPPDRVFAPVWTVLFVLMSIAAWRVWRQGGWSAIFFGARRIDWALVEIVALFIAILWTGSAFHARDRLSGWLFVPYAAWVAFALLLNASIWLLN